MCSFSFALTVYQRATKACLNMISPTTESRRFAYPHTLVHLTHTSIMINLSFKIYYIWFVSVYHQYYFIKSSFRRMPFLTETQNKTLRRLTLLDLLELVVQLCYRVSVPLGQTVFDKTEIAQTVSLRPALDSISCSHHQQEMETRSRGWMFSTLRCISLHIVIRQLSRHRPTQRYQPVFDRCPSDAEVCVWGRSEVYSCNISEAPTILHTGSNFPNIVLPQFCQPTLRLFAVFQKRYI